MNDLYLGILRHILTLAGGVLVARGLASDGDVQAIIGGCLSAASMASMLYAKRQAAKATTELKNAASSATTVAIAASAQVQHAKAQVAEIGAALGAARDELDNTRAGVASLVNATKALLP